MMLPKPSSELERMRSTPLMPEMTSSIGSITSRSTLWGEAPGYGIAITTIGASISGNSSVSSWVSASMPNTTMMTIDTTVRTGCLIEVSEMNIDQFKMQNSKCKPFVVCILHFASCNLHLALLRHNQSDSRPRCNPLRGAAEQHVTFVQAGHDLHAFG